MNAVTRLDRDTDSPWNKVVTHLFFNSIKYSRNFDFENPHIIIWWQPDTSIRIKVDMN